MAGAGVKAPAGSDVPSRLTLDLNVHHCAGDAVSIEADSEDLTPVDFSGNVISWFINGQMVEKVTDSELASNTRVGMYGEYSSDGQTRFDDFMAWIG